MKDITSFNWSRTHTREAPPFTMEITAYAYVVLLEKLSGWGYRHVLNVFKNDIEDSYRDQDDDARLIELFAKSDKEKLLDVFKKENDRVLKEGNTLLNKLNEFDVSMPKDKVAEFVTYIRDTYAGVGAVLGITRPAGLYYEKTDEHNAHVEEYAKMRMDQGGLYPKVEKALNIFFKKLSKILHIDGALIPYCTADEIVDLLHGKSVVRLDELEARKKLCVLYYSNEKASIIIGDQAKNLVSKLELQKTDIASEIKGKAAYLGKINGKVCVVLKESELKKIVAGDIIVTPMTQVSFVPYLDKVSAIVTDEGGITCHAAIIAREMKKPCIIGTKNATKIFKDGDMVEVDAEKGIVKILK